jgi:hypothetical protein
VHSPTLRQTYWGTKHYPLCLQESWLRNWVDTHHIATLGRSPVFSMLCCITGFSPVMCVTSVGEATNVEDSLTTSQYVWHQTEPGFQIVQHYLYKFHLPIRTSW